MTEWVGSKARRLLLAGAIAFATGAPTIACMGGDSGGETDGGGGNDNNGGGGGNGGGGETKADGVEGAIIGTFRVTPSDEALRELKILNAAVNGKPPPKNIKPPFGPKDKKTYQDAKRASGGEKEYIKGQLNLMKGARVTFEKGGKGKYVFDGGENPFNWTLSGASGKKGTIKMNYDHGVSEEGTITLKGSELHVHFTKPRPTDIIFKP